MKKREPSLVVDSAFQLGSISLSSPSLPVTTALHTPALQNILGHAHFQTRQLYYPKALRAIPILLLLFHPCVPLNVTLDPEPGPLRVAVASAELCVELRHRQAAEPWPPPRSRLTRSPTPLM